MTSAFRPGLALKAYPPRITFQQAIITESVIRLLPYEPLHPKEDASPGLRVPLCRSEGAKAAEAERLIQAIRRLIDET
jgi:hypothetical protein